MQAFVVAFFILFQAAVLFAQDGSDIDYVKPEELNKSHVGRKIQLDFYRRSFGSEFDEDPRAVDKISLAINGRQIEFVERRVDDGFNNWFSEQYLESVDKKIRIKEFELLGIEKEAIRARAFLNVAPFTQEFSFPKKDIAEVLIKAKNEDRRPRLWSHSIILWNKF